jgi:hypothetical protein
MSKRIRTALAALLIAFAVAFSVGAFGSFSQADVASVKPPRGEPMANISPIVSPRSPTMFDLNNGTSTISLG